jgi:hypothetical protein
VPTIVASVLSTFDNKGLKKGKKEVSAFEKQVKSFGKVFAGVFSATALLNYSKKAVSAFMADEKAAKSLELQLKNTGFAFAAPSVEYYIANLQKVTGVLDDELRPAFQSLLTSSGSITQSQEALNTALNISAATGKSLTEVSAALSRGFAGNTTGLSRLGAGLSKATLKTGDMDKILGELNQKFSGQAAARLETYAGQMDLLKVGAANASEEIGKGLLDALSLLSKDKSIEDAATAMESFGKSIGDAIYGLALLITKLDGLAKKTKTAGLADLLSRLQPGGKGAAILAGALSVYGSKDRNKPASNFTYDLGPSATKDIERANKLLKEKNKLSADELKKLKAKTEIDKLKDKFDLERINLTLALNQATDAETKLRLQAQLAILDNNEALAKKYNAELDATAKTKLLTDALAKAGLAVDAFSSFAMGAVQRGEYADAYKNISNVPTQSAGGAMQLPSAASFAMGGVSRGEYAPVTVNVAGSVLTEQSLTDTINETLLRINKMGRGTTPAGGLSGGT